MDALTGLFSTRPDTGGIEFWHDAERSGWLMKQGELIKTWRRRWFVLKDGKIFWFKTDAIGPDSIPRGVIDVHRCLSIKGAEDIVNRPHAFEIATAEAAQFFIATDDRAKEDWINAVGRAIVRHSRALLASEAPPDYTAAGGG